LATPPFLPTSFPATTPPDLQTPTTSIPPQPPYFCNLHTSATSIPPSLQTSTISSSLRVHISMPSCTHDANRCAYAYLHFFKSRSFIHTRQHAYKSPIPPSSVLCSAPRPTTAITTATTTHDPR